MKKFFLNFVAIALFSNACAMEYARRIAGVTEEEVAAALEQRKQLPTLEQEKLNTDLSKLLRDIWMWDDGVVYIKAKKLLDLGADPDKKINSGRTPLTYVTSLSDYSKLVSLFLAYGANPNLEVSYNVQSCCYPCNCIDTPITNARSYEAVKLLVRAGAGINTTLRASETALAILCLYCGDNYKLFPAIVWMLSHGADPNIGPRADSTSYVTFPIHRALFGYHLKLVIALLQNSAHLDVGTRVIKQPLDMAAHLIAHKSSVEPELRPIAKAQYELLKAVSEHKLDPHHVYKTYEYESMGISRESAELIQKATQEVNEAFAQCRLDDWRYEHPGQSLSKFIFDREMGRAARKFRK